MKPIYLALGLISCQSFAQDLAKSTQFNPGINFADSRSALTDRSMVTVLLKKNGEYVKAYLNNIPSAVMADFGKRYDEPGAITWKVDENDITGSFQSDGEKIVVTYRKNGQLVSTRKTYDGKNPGKLLRSFIQSDLNKGYTVSFITEVIGETITLYEINMINQQQVIVIRLSKNKEGEPELTEKLFFTKAPAEGF